MREIVTASTSSFSGSPRELPPQHEARRALGRRYRSPARSRRPRRRADIRRRADDLKLPNEAGSRWLSQGGRDLAAADLLPRAEAALRQELQRLAGAVKTAREVQSTFSSVSRARVTA